MITIESFKDYAEDNRSITDFTKDGKCSGCGSCCSNFLHLSNKEIDRIEKYIKQHHIKEQKHLIPTKDESMDITCPFLNLGGGDKKCVIYPVRPLICKCFVCNDPDGAKNHEELYAEKRKPVDVRETFFRKGK